MFGRSAADEPAAAASTNTSRNWNSPPPWNRFRHLGTETNIVQASTTPTLRFATSAPRRGTHSVERLTVKCKGWATVPTGPSNCSHSSNTAMSGAPGWEIDLAELLGNKTFIWHSYLSC